ncbi:MAG TPA: hypothetical protein VF678_07895, partial [bacterium]
MIPLIGWKPTLPDASVASTRIRCLNPLLELQRRGLPAELFDAAHLDGYRAVLFSKCHDPETLRQAERAKRNGARV